MPIRRWITTGCCSWPWQLLPTWCSASEYKDRRPRGGDGAPDRSTIEAGKRLYRRKCVFCHGTNGGGDGSVSRTHRRGSLQHAITWSIPGTTMPAWSNLSALQCWQLVSYTKTRTDLFEDEVALKLQSITIGTPKPPYPEGVATGQRQGFPTSFERYSLDVLALLGSNLMFMVGSHVEQRVGSGPSFVRELRAGIGPSRVLTTSAHHCCHGSGPCGSPIGKRR